ncbi:glyoxalase [Salinicoccus hispanicus]|uniref:Glyoxalase n=2 Tax=Salinicoccus hispanicus TaxID=157225 RepID=A0A6N8U6R8_9STAP|nr:VOC family protein [Salinicoccus hispanicus]MXQ52031.1 glyoxalase [Salinicoccus hispanicus]
MIKIVMIIVLVGLALSVFFFLVNTGSGENMNTAVYTEDHEPRIGHVELQVSDLDESAQFYEDLIGFSVLERSGSTVELTADGTSPQLILTHNNNFEARSPRTTGLYHLAILVPTRQDLALSIQHLTASGYPLQGAADHQYSEALYLADPDGNGIEIYTDRNPKEWVRDDNGGYVGATDQLDLENLFAEVGDAEWDGLAEGTRIGHMHLQASDLEASEAFYVDALGFDIVAQDSHMLFVSKDAYHHNIGMNTWMGTDIPQPSENTLGLKRFTFHLTEDEYREAKAGLTEGNFQFEEENEALMVEDPTGVELKLILKSE